MFQAGFARVDVTPPLGTELTGYFKKRISDGILDPIFLNALAIRSDEDTALIITGDFMYSIEKALTHYRWLITEKTGVPMDHILIQSIHQHTSTSAGIGGPTDAQYRDVLDRKFCDVAVMAIDDLKEASISIAQKETAEPISFVRRFRMTDGSTKTNPNRKHRELIDHPIGEADNTVRLVKFERKEGKDIALVNFQTHPDVIGGNKFSADWPGFTRRFIEEALPVHCILVNGCEGDTNHHNIDIPSEQNTGYEYSQYMGRVLTDTVVSSWDQTEPVAAGTITAKVVTKRIPTNMNGIEEIDECIAMYQAYQEGTLDKKFAMHELGELRRIAEMENATLVQSVPVSLIAFGKIALIGYGGEPFTEYADIPRAAVPDLFVLSACLANGAQGYLPSVSAFEEGGYEACTTNFTASVAPVLQNEAIKMLKAHSKTL